MGRAIIALDERLLIRLLDLPAGTRVLGCMNDPMRLAVAVGVESDVLPETEQGVELPRVWPTVETDAEGRHTMRWPTLEPPGTPVRAVVSDATTLVALERMEAGDVAGAQSAILADLAAQYQTASEPPVEVGHGETPPEGYEAHPYPPEAVGTPDRRAWRPVSQAVDRDCEFCHEPMRHGDTVWRKFVEPNAGAKMCAACFELLDPNGRA